MNIPKHKSLRRKRVSRMAAVQALYSRAVTGGKTDAKKLHAQIVAHWKDSLENNEPDLALDVPPDESLLMRILDGAFEYSDTIEEQIDGLIMPGWKKERMSEVLLSTLRAFAAELLAREDVEQVILIDEYTAVAASFVSEKELPFIHSALNHLARALRVR
jgi:transcription termination factor NusB